MATNRDVIEKETIEQSAGAKPDGLIGNDTLVEIKYSYLEK